MKSESYTLFKYQADRLPVAIILMISCIDFGLYFLVENVWILATIWFVMIIPKANICAWNHHHQHILTFRLKALNRVLEFFYALHTGVTTNLWLLHHVLGHHHNYLDQTKDESRWRRKSGKIMGEIEYSLNVAATAYYRAFMVGRRYPKLQACFILYSLLTFSVVAFLVWLKPLPALFLFVLPMICSLLITAWVTYDHHTELKTDNIFEASRNNLNRIFNLVTGNLGYHTAHHYKQGVHWSLLPGLHEEIKHKIPAHLINYTVFNLGRKDKVST